MRPVPGFDSRFQLDPGEEVSVVIKLSGQADGMVEMVFDETDEKPFRDDERWTFDFTASARIGDRHSLSFDCKFIGDTGRDDKFELSIKGAGDNWLTPLFPIRPGLHNTLFELEFEVV
jgi:hypothetical protein